MPVVCDLQEIGLSGAFVYTCVFKLYIKGAILDGIFRWGSDEVCFINTGLQSHGVIRSAGIKIHCMPYPVLTINDIRIHYMPYPVLTINDKGLH